MIRVVLPRPLRVLANIDGEVRLPVPNAATQGALLDSLETAYPVLRGTLRDAATLRRRPLVRFFACGQDLSHDPPGTLLPAAVVSGDEPFLVVGAIAGG